MKRVVLFLVKIAIFSALLLIGVVSLGMYANHRAERAADAFCRSISLGSELSDSITAAKSAGIRYIGAIDEQQYAFSFQGFSRLRI